MCRWLTYKGPPIYLADLLYTPKHSLIDQSLNALEAKTGTNGDGFGIGWYRERVEPGVYREVMPAWNDANLRSLAHQIRAGAFFAHVRASTGTATSRQNCHPFSHGRWLFMHNGQIGQYNRVRRKLENLIPDDLYDNRMGTTDSEVVFLLMLAQGLEDDPVGALRRSVALVTGVMDEAGIKAPFRFTSALSDGERFYAVRFSTDDAAPSMYYSNRDD
ncbi:MAG: class II glutamine amidotransferase, partial [Alphaproteobacteria bacterium]